MANEARLSLQSQKCGMWEKTTNKGRNPMQFSIPQQTPARRPADAGKAPGSSGSASLSAEKCLSVSGIHTRCSLNHGYIHTFLTSFFVYRAARRLRHQRHPVASTGARVTHWCAVCFEEWLWALIRALKVHLDSVHSEPGFGLLRYCSPHVP